MKKYLLLAAFLLVPLCASADEAESNRAALFSYETDDKSASDSLNRIAGDIDLGFAGPSQTYKSSNQKNALIDRDQSSNPVE